MRSLIFIMFSLLAISCVEKNEVRIAEAANDYITGTFAGDEFRLASPNSFEAQSGYTTSPDQWNMRMYAVQPKPDYFPETGLYAARTDRLQKVIAELVIPDNQLHKKAMPININGATLVQSYYLSDGEGCAHPDIATSEIKSIDVTINAWDDDVIEGTFLAPDDATTLGNFRLFIEHPGK